ncbi:cobalt transporter CbiM [Thermobrachium celere]|uniref:Substrate-specific component NikM of nickel ECF transporter / Additional substrate-specific component NikN of nickel ECF transporter n=1 Tax=Thermobrachium celere DSM 8682 TaxID=941824 RepID=R7RMT6_9CLOT|nr:cobalt transporter CbiM [Thermobrachium celere]CDF57487.1 Substrate-specific component NikM of nickel ECF transporter / Additional substrate-specific component NikN of nickel ECF transporter [Thermobrachium celere DSM 8682]
MHIPENYLSPSTCTAFYLAIIPIIKRTIAKVKEELDRRRMSLLGVAAAYSFLIMMFNVPLLGGTTGHAVGAVIIAILLGPYAAFISVAVALTIQALFFGDGGILSLGANIFNMAFAMSFSGYYVYSRLKSKNENLAVFLGSYIGLNIAAFLTAIEFGIQPYLFKASDGTPLYCPYGLDVSIPAMMLSHLLVAGVVEGAVSLLIYKAAKQIDLVKIYEDDEKTKGMNKVYIFIAILIALSPLGLIAQGTAWGEWGLDEIKEIAGFLPKGMEKGLNFEAIMPDYTVSGVNEVLGYIISAILGVMIIILLFRLIGIFSRKGLEN